MNRRGSDSGTGENGVRRRFRVRLTLRQLMALVAAASVLLGTAVGLQRRRDRFRRRADGYMRQASREYMIGQIAIQVTHFGPTRLQLRTQEAHFALGDYYTDLKAKYARAAARPWLPLGLDPPPPAWPRDVPYHTPLGAPPLGMPDRDHAEQP